MLGPEAIQLLPTLRNIDDPRAMDLFLQLMLQHLQRFAAPQGLVALANPSSLLLQYKGVELLQLRKVEQTCFIDLLLIADGQSHSYSGSAATPSGYTRLTCQAKQEAIPSSLTQDWLHSSQQLQQQLATQNYSIPQEHKPVLFQLAEDVDFKKQLLGYVQQASPYKDLLQTLIPSLLTQAEALAVKNAPEFYFELARQTLKQLNELELSPDFYKTFQQKYENYAGSYQKFAKALKTGTKAYEFAQLIGEFISYADNKAGGKQHWNRYEDKRSFANAGVRQQHWVSQLLRYKEMGLEKAQLSSNVENAINYALVPQQNCPILSERHRRWIAKRLLHVEYQPSKFTAQLIQFFQQFKLQTKLADNLTQLISYILYQPSIAELWRGDEKQEYDNYFEPEAFQEPDIAYHSAPSVLNRILYGPPGTGKTYRAQRLALSIVEGLPLAELEQWGEPRRKQRFQQRQAAGQIATVSFHPSMAYEDFIEGIKPFVHQQQLSYQLQDGILKTMALQANQSPIQPHVLIIDEINRGNVAAIFGELISLLEKDKRAGAANSLQIILPYSRMKFQLPPNLFIIGTMNTADRNIEALDTALRRRFSFFEMRPQPQLLLQCPAGIQLDQMLATINQRIELLLDPDHSIGHAYFWEVDNLERLNAVFERQIIPLLLEYFYGDLQKLALILGSAFVQQQTSNHNIFPKHFSRQLDFSQFSQQSLELIPFPHSAADYLSIYQH